ncbi:MAG: ThiF family adenylyltransferase [Polyangiales bacterium]
MSARHRVLVIGTGGLGSPVLRFLAQSGVDHVTVVDDDVVEESNLHRQTVFTAEDVGRSKTACAVAYFRTAAPALSVEAVEGRFVPTSARALLEGHTVIVEGADNLPTKFLAADASRLAGLPVVQAGVVRWGGWAWCALPDSACLRCLFEDIPRDRVETCAEAGVMGPVVGVLGGLQAALLARVLEGERPGGELWHYQALGGGLRKAHVRRRGDCPLCAGDITDLRMERYTAACAA